MSKILIYCPRVSGHRLEYLHHLHVGASHNNDNSYIFAIAQDFYSRKGAFEWKDFANISFLSIPNSFIKSVSNVIRSSYYRCKGLRWAIKTSNPDKVIVLDMIEYVPFLPFLVPSKVKVSGIVYRIFLYEWENESLFMRFQDWLKYIILSRFCVYDRVFILNDSHAARILNDRFRTSKFRYLPDPVAIIRNPEHLMIRKQYGIDENKTIFLHPGGMQPYKGTLELLKALTLVDNRTAERIVVIFAGRVTESIRDAFFPLFDKVKQRVQVFLDEGFLPFEKLGGYFVECDWVLIPYTIKSQSSGVIGHAAFFKKPVIAVNGGLIGSLVQNYKLGILLADASPYSIKNILDNLPSFNNNNNNYVENHSIESFIQALFTDGY